MKEFISGGVSAEELEQARVELNGKSGWLIKTKAKVKQRKERFKKNKSGDSLIATPFGKIKRFYQKERDKEGNVKMIEHYITVTNKK